MKRAPFLIPTRDVCKLDAMGIELQSELHNYIFFKEFGCTLVPYGFLGDDSKSKTMDSTLGFPKPFYQLTLCKKHDTR